MKYIPAAPHARTPESSHRPKETISAIALSMRILSRVKLGSNALPVCDVGFLSSGRERYSKTREKAPVATGWRMIQKDGWVLTALTTRLTAIWSSSAAETKTRGPEKESLVIQSGTCIVAAQTSVLSLRYVDVAVNQTFCQVRWISQESCLEIQAST